MTIEEADAYCALLQVLHTKQFKHEYDSCNYRTDCAGHVEYMWCSHNLRTTRMYNLQDVVKHIKAVR